MTHCRIRPHELEWNIVKTDLYALRGIPQPGPTEHMQKLAFRQSSSMHCKAQHSTWDTITGHQVFARCQKHRAKEVIPAH